jgi:hypothetical protein
MVWFKVDDHLHDHRKVRRLGRDKLPAMGLWVLCGSWVADETNDGFVPEEIIQRYDPTLRYARRLVAVGLWEELPEPGDEEGLDFHQWDEHQPTADQVEAKRQADAARKARWREGKKAAAEGESRPASRRDSRRDSNVPVNPDSVTERSTPASNPSHDHHKEGLKITRASAPDSGSSDHREDRPGDIRAGREGVSRRDSRWDTTRDSQRESQPESQLESRSTRPDPTFKTSSLSVSSTSRECLAQAGIDDETEINKILELVRAENPGIRNERAYIARLIDNGDLPALRDRAQQPTEAPRTAKAQTFIDNNGHDFEARDPDDVLAGCQQCPLPAGSPIHKRTRAATGGDAA